MADATRLIAVTLAAAIGVSLLASATARADGEVVLNHVDPQGVELALAPFGQKQRFEWLGPDVMAMSAQQAADPGLAPCRALPDQQVPCGMSDLTRNVLAVVAPDRDRLAAELEDLLGSQNLVRDTDAAKRVLVGLNDANAVEYVDFVGLVRGRDEVLAAPDAVSAFVVRVDKGGTVSIFERQADAAVDMKAMRFPHEARP